MGCRYITVPETQTVCSQSTKEDGIKIRNMERVWLCMQMVPSIKVLSRRTNLKVLASMNGL